MKFFKVYIVVVFLFGACLTVSTQNPVTNSSGLNKTYDIRGSVYDKDTYEPYSNVKIFVNGKEFTSTSFDGTFSIKAKIGDQLIASHDDFETIYHTINSRERITIEVQNESYRTSGYRSKKQNIKVFNALIDSADIYLKQDAAKSIQFITNALTEDITSNQNAIAHEVLGDVYSYWKQYDLAISAYQTSLDNSNKSEVTLKLAQAHLNNDNIQKSIALYSGLKSRRLSNYNKVLKFEGLGDAYLQNKDYAKAVETYQRGLEFAEDYDIKSKITDLNSKLAQSYSSQGLKVQAKGYFSKSLNLASQQSEKRSLEEKVTVAEFNNANQNYDDEIQLRKQVIETVEDIEEDSIIPNESAITPQKQNYKIGNALILQNEYEAALPFLDKSIEVADKRGDLEVKNDALRKKVDVYENLGDFDKAKEEFQKFVASVDSLYIKKQQEISRAARFSRNIAEQRSQIAILNSDRQLSQSKFELTQERNKRQQLIIYSLLGGIILFLITGFFMYKYIKQQRLANNLLALKSLRSQMNPHFIFNALNSVNSFIAMNDERTANKYLSDFSHLMRSVLENSEEDFISLKKELELISLYTKLEHFRFKDKFDYQIDIDDNISISEYDIPPMLLQPYIENAVWHGLRYKTEKGLLRIAMQPKDNSSISISIIDDGIGRERSKALKTENQKRQKSKGMTNIKKRVAILNDMYKDQIDVEISNYQDQEDVGTKVVVTLKKK